MKKALKNFFGDDPAASNSYGKIINERRFDALVKYLDEGKIVVGGRHDKSNLFIAPTIMVDMKKDAALRKEEIFGPILPVYFFSESKDALSIVRENPDPLSFYLF